MNTELRQEQQENAAPNLALPPTQDIPVDGGILKIFPDNSSIMIPNTVKNVTPQYVDPQDFYANLAPLFSSQELSDLGLQLKKGIEEDFNSRKAFIDGVTETLKQIGFELTTSGPMEVGSFKHASDVRSSALMETVMHNTLSAYEQLFPATDLVDTAIWGQYGAESEDAANRIKNYTNAFLTYERPDFRPESKKVMLFAITAGAGHSKIYIDPVLNMPVKIKIPLENFVIHKDYACQAGSMRKTHLEYISPHEFEVRQNVGYYLKDEEVPPSSSEWGWSPLTQQFDRMSGIDAAVQSEEEKKLICMGEVYLFRFFQQDPLKRPHGLVAPYRIALNKDTGTISGIWRNWRERDPSYKEKRCITSWVAFPAYEGEGYGLAHMCGNQSRAATTVARMIADATLFKNFPSFLYQRGMSMDGNNIRLVPGQGFPVPTTGPLAEAIMPVPFNGASNDIFMLQDNLENNIKKFAGIMSSQLLDMSPNTPVTTTLAILESSNKMPNAILSGWFESFTEELDVLRECFYDWMVPGQPYSVTGPQGSVVVFKEDFEGHIRLIPKSSPSTHNSTYRLLKASMLLNTAQSLAQYHNMPGVLQQYYKEFNLTQDEIQSILPPAPQQAVPLDPGTENANMLTGLPVVVGIDQDHQAHETVHSVLLQNPDPGVVASAQAHIKDHQAKAMLLQLQAQTGIQLPPDPAQVPMEVQNQIAMAMAQAVLQQQQQMQQQQPPPPIDPSLVALEEIKQQGQIASMKNQTELLKIQNEIEKNKRESLYKEHDLNLRKEIDLLKLELEAKKLELSTISKLSPDSKTKAMIQ